MLQQQLGTTADVTLSVGWPMRINGPQLGRGKVKISQLEDHGKQVKGGNSIVKSLYAVDVIFGHAR